MSEYVRLTTTVRRVADGEEVTLVDYLPTDTDLLTYVSACDCWREVDFRKARGEPDRYPECGQGAYHVRADVDGVVLIDELGGAACPAR